MTERVKFFAIRTTIGQEHNVALLLEERAKASGMPVYSIIVATGLKGIVVIESDAPYIAQRLGYGIKHVKGAMRGGMRLEDLEKFVAPKPVIEMIRVNDIVEITGGPFIGMKGKVVQVDKSRGEVKVEIAEAAYPLPITINAEYVRIVGREAE